MGTYGVTVMDYGREKSTVKLPTGPINAATIVSVSAQALALRTAMANISRGSFTSERLVAYDNNLAGAAPGSVEAQRESKWLVTYEDSASHRLARCEVPCALLTLLKADSDEADYADPAISAFTAAFEALVVGPDGGSSNVLTIRHVGRNL